jgi:hypothetical protein
VQARGAVQGGLAFREGDYIHELVGVMKPFDTSHDYMSIEVDRKDIGPICMLDCRTGSNWVRLVNHACNPCAIFDVVIKAGRARVMLKALKDIRDGMEITV